MKKLAIVIGAGPAGLTSAYELLSRSEDYDVLILEATNRVGGISCTINHNDNRIDIGGHRFFSKSDVVMKWWEARMPVQGSPSRDQPREELPANISLGGPDPESQDRVMLVRNRLSRIFFMGKFFDYPVSLSVQTIKNLGLVKTLIAGLGFFWAQVFSKKEDGNLESFLINRFGRPLYEMFFERYTEKVWGLHPRAISADWGAQRIKGLSLFKVLTQATKKFFFRRSVLDIRQKSTETSLIESFYYPKLGPGQMWEYVLQDVVSMGAKIKFGALVTGLAVGDERLVDSVTVRIGDEVIEYQPDVVLSTMPIKDLVAGSRDKRKTPKVSQVAAGLQYRDFMTVGLLVNKLSISKNTIGSTMTEVIPDTWVYIQEPQVKLCRLQIFNNWSPYLVSDPSKVWIGLEYMCSDSDEEWLMSDKQFIEFAINELESIGFITRSDVIDSTRIKMEKAYPAYFGTYSEFETVKSYLNGIQNLFCLGRNGQHRYNNQDHSMLTAIEAVDQITTGVLDRERLWGINAEHEYHEEKQS